MQEATEQDIREAFERLKRSIETMEESLFDAFKQAMHGPVFLDLQRAAEYKGIGYGTLRSPPWKQPLAGFSRDRDGRKRFWPRQEIERWAQAMSTDDRLEYLREKLYCGDREIEAGVLSVLQTYAAEGRLPEAERQMLDEVTEERFVRA